jgi:hypothetical protein
MGCEFTEALVGDWTPRCGPEHSDPDGPTLEDSQPQ